MTHRTTLLLDDKTRAAAQDLAARMRVPVSEAIRRAILQCHSQYEGTPPSERTRRVAALKTLVESFQGYDAADELRALETDEGF